MITGLKTQKRWNMNMKARVAISGSIFRCIFLINVLKFAARVYFCLSKYSMIGWGVEGLLSFPVTSVMYCQTFNAAVVQLHGD